jgi:hypothetical protein
MRRSGGRREAAVEASIGAGVAGESGGMGEQAGHNRVGKDSLFRLQVASKPKFTLSTVLHV